MLALTAIFPKQSIVPTNGPMARGKIEDAGVFSLSRWNYETWSGSVRSVVCKLNARKSPDFRDWVKQKDLSYFIIET
ncbi:MAG: hypothetical protein ACU83N_04530 [Gammaproteobacteria bacterium]